MPPLLALAVGLAFVFVLLAIEHRRATTSFALWIPTIWMFFAASRPLSRWFAVAQSSGQSEGSLLDRLMMTALILAGMAILIGRRRQIDWGGFVRRNFWLIAFFLYLGLSAMWSEVPYISLKRWIRTSGVIVMAMVVMTEAEPLPALERIVRRCAYVLLPLSIIFIKYFPEYGRQYVRWDGVVMWTGVTTHKNSLGALCAISVLVIVTSLFRKRPAHDIFWPRLQTLADLSIVALAAILLRGAEEGTYSATAVVVVVAGSALSAVLLTRKSGGRLIAAHLRVFAVVAVLLYLAFWDAITTTGATLLNRRTDLTGRATEIWPFVLQEAAKHPILGGGYGGVWNLGGDLSTFLGLEQAHNGYLDVYLQLGIVGCVLLALFLLEFCARIGQQFKCDRLWGVFGITFFFINLIYNLSETAFFDVNLGALMVVMTVTFSVSGQTAAEREVEALPQPLAPPRRWRPPSDRRRASEPAWQAKPVSIPPHRWPTAR